MMQERSQARGTADCISSCLVLSRLVSSRLFSRRCRRLHPEAPPLDACAFPEIPLVGKNRNAMPDGDPNSRHIAPGSCVPDRDSIIQFQPTSQPNIAPSSPTFYSYLTRPDLTCTSTSFLHHQPSPAQPISADHLASCSRAD